MRCRVSNSADRASQASGSADTSPEARQLNAVKSQGKPLRARHLTLELRQFTHATLRRMRSSCDGERGCCADGLGEFIELRFISSKQHEGYKAILEW